MSLDDVISCLGIIFMLIGWFVCMKQIEKIEKMNKDKQETANLYKCPNCGTWVSAENVVRCKECTQNNQCSIQFKFADADNPGDWFCAYGKRKEER